MAIPRGSRAGAVTMVSNLPAGPLTKNLCDADFFKVDGLVKWVLIRFLDDQQGGH